MWSNDRTQGVWTGQDVKDFIWVMVYTGLRISDVSFFNINRLRGNELFLRAKKNGGDVYTWIPDWLCERLRELAEERGMRPFVIGQSDRLETVTDLWRRKINRVFDLAGPFEERATPHRSGTRSRESYFRRACRLPMLPICSAMTRTPCVSITRDGCRNVRRD